MTNGIVAAPYVERVERLALGLEPIDAGRRGRVAGVVAVQLEDVPRPFVGARRTLRTCTYDIGLPALDRHPSSRYVLLYSSDPHLPVSVRLFDCGRWFVPRRLRIPLLTIAQIQSAEAAAAHPEVPPELLPPQPPVSTRVRRPVLFPGAGYPVDTLATGLRGRVLRGGKPMRWARVEARDPASNVLLARAHGDDRGEFFLLLGSVATPANVAQLADPVAARVEVFGPSIAPAPAPGATVDPLWDLPVEIASFPGDPDPVTAGESLPPDYVPTPTSTRVMRLPVGQVTTGAKPFVFA